jgi:hypothetical protein
LSDEPVKKGLLSDLQAQKKFNSRVYVVLFVFICAMVVLGLAALLTDTFKGQNQRYALIAAAGVSIPTSVEWMRRVIREWSQLNLLITLVANSDENAIQLLIQKLLSASALGNS